MTAERKKLKRAYISVGYASNPDIVSLTAKHGIQGKCASYDLNLMMSGANNGTIDRETFLYVAKINEVADPVAFLDFCILKTIFIEVESGYSNTIVQRDQEAYAQSLERDRKRKRNDVGIRTESERNPSENQREKSGLPDIDIDNDYEDPSIKKYSEVTRTADEVRITPNALTLDNLRIKLKSYGLEDYLDAALDALARHYYANPERITRGCLNRDISALWLRTELKKLKNEDDKSSTKVKKSAAARAADVVRQMTEGAP